ncbi:MAG: DUF4249 domain-containing protein [Bacteroidetes bacterium]|nr:MAG: DUF4249 domain-containing protein [Bacteroidota bacterium]
MMKRYGWIWLLLLTACVSEIDYEPQTDTYTAISGVITNSVGERSIFVQQYQGFGLKGIPLAATGRVYKNGSEATELIPIRPGELAVPLTFAVEEGASYHLEISLDNGRQYKSLPVLVPPRLQTDSLTFELEERLDGYSQAGAPIFVWYVDVYAHVTLPEKDAPQPYFKWQVDESWSFVSSLRTCYIPIGVEENPVTILGPEGLQPGKASVRIATRALGKEFLDVHYYNAYLHAIDEKTYDFYRKARQLSSEVGSLYDQVPGPLQGNVYSVGSTDKFVVGNVEFSLVDTLRLRIERQDIDLRIYNQCGAAIPCPITGPGPRACACNDCVSVYGFNSQVKPWYWD